MESTVDRHLLGFLGIAFFIVVIVLTLAVYLDRAICDSKWSDSGYESRWSLLASCQVKHNGVWIPEKNFRTID